MVAPGSAGEPVASILDGPRQSTPTSLHRVRAYDLPNGPNIDKWGSAESERRSWLTRRDNLTAAAEAHAKADKVPSYSTPAFVITYLNRAEVIRELLLFLDRQISSAGNIRFSAPASPPPAGHEHRHWHFGVSQTKKDPKRTAMEIRVLAMMPVIQKAAADNGWIVTDYKVCGDGTGPDVGGKDYASLIAVSYHGEDPTLQKLVHEYMLPLPQSSGWAGLWRPCTIAEQQASEKTYRNNGDFWDNAEVPRPRVAWQQKFEQGYEDGSKNQYKDRSQREEQKTLEAHYNEIAEELIKTLDLALDIIPGTPDTERSQGAEDLEEMAGVPDQATGGSQPEEDAESEMSSPMNEPDQPQEVKVEYEEHVRLWEEKMVLEKQVLENTVCELRDDIAHLAHALLKSRDYEDDDDSELLARLPSKNLPRKVVERLLMNPFSQRQRDESRKRRAVEERNEANTKRAIKTEDGVDDGDSEDTIVVEPRVNGPTKRRKR